MKLLSLETASCSINASIISFGWKQVVVLVLLILFTEDARNWILCRLYRNKCSTLEAITPPPTFRGKVVGNKRQGFSIVAFHLWNALPLESCLAPTLLSHSCQTKAFLLT